MSMILNPYRYAAAGGETTFGGASRTFDGSSDFLDCGNDSSLNPTDFSILCWFYVTARSAENFFVGRDATFGRSYSVGIRSTGQLQIQINGLLKGLGTTDFDITGNQNKWFHAAFISESGVGTEIFLDGVSEATDTYLTANTTTGPTTIGARSYSGLEGFFAGNLADVRIYNRALSASEISDVIAGIDVTSGLQGRWIGNADNLNDLSGNGNDASEGAGSSSTYSTNGPFD